MNLVPNAECFFLEKKKLVRKSTQELFQGKDIDFCMLYNNRNIRRKMTSDALLAFQEFRNRLPEEKKDKLFFKSDSDALIAKGLVTLITSIYSNEAQKDLSLIHI